MFNLKHFTLAIIDEASQILEPDLIGILSARHNRDNAIDKFILIGDYKQLPAIAQQNEEEARIDDPLLQSIGLTDCRNSLFERLYKQSDEAFRSVLHKQGRMHPAISEFPNNTFYYREQLEPIPLPHQEESLPYPSAPAPQDNLDRLIQTRRMVFIPSETPDNINYSEKTNINEARIVATLLTRIYRMTSETFDANKTVGVIVPYRNQIAMIRREIAQTNIPELNNISIDTVERYQGSQRDVIIYSFTIQNFSQLNFLTSNTFREGEYLIDRKLNVAITRARKQLFLTGNPQILGANITFYKLMEYIRMNNGYIDVGTEAFCRGDFELPEYTSGWDVQSDSYLLPESFRNAFQKIVTVDDEALNDEARNRELVAYGRYDFSSPDDEIPASKRLQLYNYYYMRRAYCAARALYETNGNWLFNAIRNVSGRVVFCDLSYESGASGLAFVDACRRLPHLDLTYLGIYPIEEMDNVAQLFFEQEAYRSVTCSFYPRIGAVPSTFWSAHSVLSELIIFNLSSLFDRISPREARDLALQINQLVHARPLNHYTILFRDDAGERMNNHSYKTFCAHLTQAIRPLNEQMPFADRFFYSREAEHVPVSETFMYEIRSNK